MPDPKIEPPKITKPIQLLAAWLAGLVLINGAFLTAAGLIYNPSWAAGMLVIAAVSNVPLFLVCLFLLQTKFRPEMQEDEFYHKYLENRFSSLTGKSEMVQTRISSEEAISPAATTARKMRGVRSVRSLAPSDEDSHNFRIQLNDLLPFFRPLLDDLVLAGLKPSDTFGSTSKEPTVPTPFIVSIGESVPFDVLKKVLAVVRKYKPEGLAYTRNHTGMHHKNVYIGAYSYEDNSRPYLRLNEDSIRKLLAPDATQALWDSMIPLDSEPDVAKE